MTELEIFSEITIKHGGEWWKLEENESYSLHLSKTKYEVKGRVYYNPPVFQIFNNKGKRIFATENRLTAYQHYNNLCKGGAE